MFKVNDIVKLILVNGVNGGRLGDLAVVVDGQYKFSDLYGELHKSVGADNIGNFIWVEWLGPYPYRPEKDGAYHESRFEIAKRIKE